MSRKKSRLLAGVGRSLMVAVLGAVAFGNPVLASSRPSVEPAQPSPARVSAGAPNVVLILLDDVGFGAASTFGGPAATPALDAVASEGLRYNRFHTAGICSPTRASLLSGRNPHAVNIGAVMNLTDARPGYSGVHARDAATVAELLRRGGYNTAAFGKWHQTPDWELSQSGPFDRWPTGMGFEKFYGFMGGESDQFEPTLIEGTTPILRPAGDGYHLTEDMADQAIRWMRTQHSLAPDKPFFLYFAPGATHAPLQAPQQWVDAYRGQFDMGWDAIREGILTRQMELGVVPAGTEITPRPEELPAWDSLSPQEKHIAARLMEVYAGFLTHTDAQIGRLIDSLKASGQFENTLFIYIVGDNGASAEGGLAGSLNYFGSFQRMPEDRDDVLRRLDEAGGPASYPHYPAAWAWAMNTPFQWTKTVASHLGGTRNPMVISWPRQIADRGGLRSQFGHVSDIMPTILQAAGLEAPAVIDGVTQQPVTGTSMVYTFANSAASERHTTQYFEVFGHRALYHDGWMASAFHERLPWAAIAAGTKPFEADRWELYNLRVDFSQARDLAAAEPARLRDMQARFMAEAARNQVLPLSGAGVPGGNTQGDPNRDRVAFTYYPGAIGVPETVAPKILNRSWSLSATVDVVADQAGGVIAALGGTSAGWSLHIDGEGKPVFTYRLFDTTTLELAGDRPLTPGRHVLNVDFDYDGGGYGKGGDLRFRVNDAMVGQGRLPATPPAFFTIIETFDVGVDTGAPVGRYPADAEIGYAFHGGEIERVDIRLR